MKKIFTFFALSIMAMSVMAAETVLWEGTWYVSWDEPEGSEHREWKHLGQADFAAYEVGTTVCFYMEQAEGATYAKYQIDNWSWVLLPGQSGTDFSGNTIAKLPITQEVKDAIAEGGFAIHGHGFNVKKVSLSPIEIPETEEPEEPGTETAVDNTTIPTNASRYNLMGQKVDENYKGVIILNGRKMIVR
jgi:hypothetical protein